MKAITVGMLDIESSLVISDILEFEIEHRKNKHAMVRITGVVPDTVGIDPILNKLEHTPLTVTAMGEEEPLLIFGGFIHTMQISQEGTHYIARLEGISSTELLDHEEKFRSFQDTDMTYKEVVRAVLADTPGSQVIFNIEDRKISAPIYQYRETDWDFLKRIASHLGTSLLPAGISSKSELYFGLHRGKLRTEISHQAVKVLFDKPYRAAKSRFICQEIVSYEKLNVEDKLRLADDREITVLSIQGNLKNGLLTYSYTVGYPEVFGTVRYENACIAGVSLAGTVLETSGESVRVWLDIDREQPKDQAFWYPWMPETGNLMYCMLYRIGLEQQ